jgi:uncharacterized protein
MIARRGHATWTLRLLGAASVALALVGCQRSESATPIARGSQTAPPLAGGPAHVTITMGPNRSPLTGPIGELQIDRVKALLEAGADPNLREAPDAKTWPPLALALRGRGMSPLETAQDDVDAQKEIASTLLAHGADPNVRWCGDDDPVQCDHRTGVTALMYAAILGDEAVASMLIGHGADTSLRDWRGLTAADYWGVWTKPESWCSHGPRKESLLVWARELANDPSLDTEIAKALAQSPDRTVEFVEDERVCQSAAVQAARHRMTDPTVTSPREILPVLVVRVGAIWVALDGRDRISGELGYFDRSWRLLLWHVTT